MRTLDKEEEVIVLYALHACGGRGSKRRIVYYILQSAFCKPREGDGRPRGGETKLENDLAWARENLKEKGQLSMPERGVWQITEAGQNRLFRITRIAYGKGPEEIEACWFDRYSDAFVQTLMAFGKKLSDQESQPQDAVMHY